MTQDIYIYINILSHFLYILIIPEEGWFSQTKYGIYIFHVVSVSAQRIVLFSF